LGTAGRQAGDSITGTVRKRNKVDLMRTSRTIDPPP
jgi:hypothetical protein